MNELTKRLFAEGWTEDHHPGHVFWAFIQGFRYKWEHERELVWKTPCGLFASGWTVGSSDTSYGGVDYIPENDNPLVLCPYKKKACEHIPEGLRGKYPLCPCHTTEEPYDKSRSLEAIEEDRAKRYHEQYMEITGGSYCACVCDTNGFQGGLVRIEYDVQKCINYGCQNEYCVIRKQPRDLTKVNIFYDVRRTKITRKGFLESTEVTVTKGEKVFEKPVARTDAEIWLKVKQAEYTPLNNRQVIQGKTNRDDHRMQFFSDLHRTWPGYDYFEFHYEVENIRIEKKESRDLLQDLRDVEQGLTVVHASDLKKAAAKAKKDRRQAYREAKEDKRQKRIKAAKAAFDEKYGRKDGAAAPPSEPEQLSFF